ncbi:MAG: glycerophosphodiester phosphodiesterase [Burkholderiaceae bacterium]|nr:glycerophosphodiester phosphodiesterase [Burkholderiaceae bacterium]
MWPYPKVLAHRGAGKLAPENTLAAMRKGLALGYRAVEFDVMLSKDGVPVLMHDPEFGRTVVGDGMVATTLAADLMRMDAGAWFSPEYIGECIPSYESVLNFCHTHKIFMNVEIKPSPGFEVQTGRMVAAITNRFYAQIGALNSVDGGAVDWQYPLFSSFSYDALIAAMEVAPTIPRGFLTETVAKNWREQLQKIDAISLHTNHQTLNQPIAAEIKRAGFGLFCYTVNDLERASEIRGWGVDAFCTDRIDLISASF